MESQPTLTFRILGLYDEDFGKSHIRLDSAHMEKLGVKSGDVVKVFGTKTAGARCFPMESSYKGTFDADFVFLDDASKNIPMMRVSHIVSFNARGGDAGSLMQVSKTKAVEATQVTLATMKEQFQYEEANLDLVKLDGLVVCKGNRVNISHLDSSKTTPFSVRNASPQGDFHIIGKNTKFEFVEVTKDDFYQNPELEGLCKVIPAVKQIKTGIFELTFPALEVYDTGTRFYFYVKEKLVPKRQEFGHPTLYPTVKITDDLGNLYVVFRYQGQGGHSDDMIDFHYSMYGIMVPPLAAKAKELNFVIQEISWHRMPSPSGGVEARKRSSANFMTPVKMTIEVLGGPWEFKIPLR